MASQLFGDIYEMRAVNNLRRRGFILLMHCFVSVAANHGL
ncbi:hypothetical protein M3J09_005935 [Ascochyta lentis]